MPAPVDRDRHIRRSGDDYAQAFLSLLPQGQAWPRTIGSTLERVCNGLAQYWGSVDNRAGELLEVESDPRITAEMLDWWERAWGLPDPCWTTEQTLTARRTMLMLRYTMIGAQSRAWFIEISALLGYTIEISELAPYMCGISKCGGQLDEMGLPRWQLGPPELRFYWKVHVHDAPLHWFRVTQSECGVDPHLRIGFAEDLECILRRWKPAHTEIVFDYSGYIPGDPMAGTP